jgi:putative (di)nucleoside polyphosphate hydrolase
MPDSAYFRAGVGLLIVNDSGEVLAFERIDIPGSWQAPQGGIEAGENPRQAAARELYEETGLRWDEIDLLDEHPEWLAYELPAAARSDKTGIGQVQKWFLLRLLSADRDIRLDSGDQAAEFARCRWMPMAHLVTIVWEKRRSVYAALAQYWRQHLA